MKKRTILILAVLILVLTTIPVQAASAPTTAIVSVVQNQSVTIRTTDFPANHTFHILMGFNNTLGVNGYLVSKLTTGSGGSFLAKFPIPEELANESVIAIRFESITDPKYYTYNWFYNTTGADTSTTTSSSSSSSTGGVPDDFPTFDILSVVSGSSVTLQTRYFPPDERFAVFMKDGASHIKTWYEVAGIETGEGNVLNMTFNIPSEIRYKDWIAIKFYNINTGFITYNLFENINQ